MSLSVIGLLGITNSGLNKLQADTRKRILGRLASETSFVTKEIKKKIKLIRAGGRRYGNHQASPPYAPPNEHTSNLRKSIRYRKNNKKGIFIRSNQPKGSSYPYNVALEFGTKNMKPRPFFYSTINIEYKKIAKKVLPDIYEIMKNDLHAQLYKKKKVKYG